MHQSDPAIMTKGSSKWQASMIESAKCADNLSWGSLQIALFPALNNSRKTNCKGKLEYPPELTCKRVKDRPS